MKDFGTVPIADTNNEALIRKALSELSAYRALGTPEEIKARLENSVELPFIPMQEVWYLHPQYNGGFAIVKGKIEGYKINYYTPSNLLWAIINHTIIFLQNVFLTREAAEARLKELEGKE